MEEIELYLDDAKDMMSKAITHLIDALSKIRAGKAMPAMLGGVMVDYYGNMTPLSQVANISSPDARTLMIKPWEKAMIQEIEKAIMNSDLGLNPQNDGEQVIINIPALTEERRTQLVKLAKNEGEQAKISIRNARKDTNDGLKSLKNDGVSEDEIKTAEEKVQKLTDEFSKKVDDFIILKEKDIMTV
ncbi:MAG: ribosome recycling factor [Cyclobacteriaceae bacterium]|nr:ribosome recycling factor [Cyclobacteriaceae bacterium]